MTAATVASDTTKPPTPSVAEVVPEQATIAVAQGADIVKAAKAPRPTVEPGKKGELREKLLLMLIEKGILALVFVFIGFSVSKNIEEVRARQAGANLVADRALKVLDDLNQPLAEVYRVIERVQSSADPDAKISMSGQLIQSVGKIRDKLGNAADSTWITPGASSELLDILTSVSKKKSSEVNLEDAKAIRARVENLKRKIINDPLSDT